MLKRRGKPVRDTRELRQLTAALRQMDLSFDAGAKNALRQLGENARARRLELLLSQAQVAGAIGLTQPAYGQLERGSNAARFVTLLRVAHALNTTPAKLLDGVKL